ncbi:MAG: methyltransferase domain-containing protein [Candidatus Bathyarchaeia archaeon]
MHEEDALMKVFDKYAQYYDLLYMDKDYEKECDFIEEVFQKISSLKIKRILDVGCGTGNHLVLLAKRGYEVVGVEKSESMAQIAEEKIHKHKLRARVVEADALDFNLNEEFDACISMFAVINYIIQTDDLIKVFKNIRRHLKQGALFVFDFWYGPAVLTIKPSSRVKIVEKEGIKVVRTVVPELDTFNCIVKSNYYLIAIKEGKIVDEVREVHVLRYLFPQELIHYLSETGFKVLKFCEFPYLDKPPSENTWNVAVIAAAK